MVEALILHPQVICVESSNGSDCRSLGAWGQLHVEVMKHRWFRHAKDLQFSLQWKCYLFHYHLNVLLGGLGAVQTGLGRDSGSVSWKMAAWCWLNQWEIYWQMALCYWPLTMAEFPVLIKSSFVSTKLLSRRGECSDVFGSENTFV